MSASEPHRSERGCLPSGGEHAFDVLNRTCYCLTLDEDALRRRLEGELNTRGLAHAMLDTHPQLFSAAPMFVSSGHLQQMARVVEAVEEVVASRVFREAAFAWAPDIARFDPGSRGGLLGYDFHLSGSAPQLIEINTNPGGALLSVEQGRAQRSCCPDVARLTMAPTEAEAVENALLDVFVTEWRMQRGDLPLQSIAILDDAPSQQYLYPEFLLYQNLFRRSGIEALICDPRELVRRDGRLWHESTAIDLAYNRLTDFGFEKFGTDRPQMRISGGRSKRDAASARARGLRRQAQSHAPL